MLRKLFNLTSVAAGIAVGLLVTGVLALAGGQYAKDVVHDQLTPQNIAFPPKGEQLPPNLNQYASEKVDTGAEAKAYANDYIGLHLEEIGGGRSYAEVSTEARMNPENVKLAEQRESMFMGEMLRGTLLSAWGWSTVGTIATIAGATLIVIGAILLAIPLLVLFGRRRESTTRGPAPAVTIA